MSQELQEFDFRSSAIRLHVEGEHVEYCAKDVAVALGYANPMKAVRDHCRGERFVHPLQTAGGMQEATFISEGDVYRLIASSKLPAAVEFEHWLFDEVLPSIRKRGAYMTEQTVERILSDPDTLIRLATDLKHEREARKQAERQVMELEPKAQALDAFVSIEGSRSISETAKILTNNGVTITGIQLRRWMADNGWIFRSEGHWVAYAKAVDNGWLMMREYEASGTRSNGERFAFAPQVRVTRKGMEALHRKMFTFEDSLFDQEEDLA